MEYSAANIRQLAQSGELEVEHIIGAALVRDEAIAAELESLKRELSWPHTDAARSQSKIPLADWADTAIQFIREGYAGLRALPRSKLSFTTALLAQDLREESAEALNDIAQNIGSSASAEEKGLLSTAFNLVLCFDHAPQIDENLRQQIKNHLHGYYQSDIPENTKATVCCALRGVGDGESIKIIQAGSKVGGPWAGVETTVIKAIKGRNTQ